MAPNTLGSGPPPPEPSTASSRTSLNVLLTAVNDLAAGHDLDTVLHRVVELACAASGAAYGALGVIDPVDPTRLYRFITHGLTQQERDRIGDLPTGRGLLGRLIRHPVPVRLPDLARAPEAAGFPPGHPPMRSFLGVPLQVADRVFGNLYLTDKRPPGADPGTGADPSPVEFTEADQQVVQGLAAVAGAVIDTVQQRAALDAQRAVVDGIWRVHHSLQGDFDLHETLPLVTDRVQELTGARAVAVVHLEDGAIRARATSGDAARMLHDLRESIHTVLAGGGPVDQYTAAELDRAASAGGGTGQRTRTSILPVSARSDLPTALVVAGWRPTTGLSEDRITELLQLFSTQVAVVLDQADRDDDRRMLALLEDRDRIARDLHDLVIQRLFAVGLQLQGASRLAGKPTVVERLQSAVTELDATIRDIRASIFELHYRPGQTSLKSDLRELISSYGATLGFEPVVQFRGPLDSTVDDDLQIQILAVLREALSNVARHAAATACQVEVDVEVGGSHEDDVSGGSVQVRVTDNGIGIPESIRESGVRNVRSRAEAVGGSLQLSQNVPHGTVLVWTAPLAQSTG